MAIAINTAFQKTSKGIRLLSEQPALDIAKREGTWYNSLTSKMKRNGGVDAPRSVTTVCEGDYCMSKHNIPQKSTQAQLAKAATNRAVSGGIYCRVLTRWLVTTVGTKHNTIITNLTNTNTG